MTNDKKQVFALLQQTQLTKTPSLNINRRSFCTFTGLSLLSLFLPGCSDGLMNSSLKQLSHEIEFQHFFDIIFPASELGLAQHREASLKRIQHLEREHELIVIHTYQRFKRLLWLKRDLGTKEYNTTIGLKTLSDLLHSRYERESNRALDIIYYTISKDSKMIEDFWGRKFSVTDKKCVYWDNYDQAIS